MLKLLRRKSFRKSKDLNSESGWRGSAARSGAYSGGGQYSVSSVRQRRRSSSGLQSTPSLSPTDNNYASLDRPGCGSGQQHSGDNVRVLRSRYSSLSNTNSEDNPPEILQYARPPENLASPVRESNSYLPESVVTSKQDCETTIQKLFFDSVVNGGKDRDGGERQNSAEQRSRSEARRSVIVRESLQGAPARRRSSSNNNNNNNTIANNISPNNTSSTSNTTPSNKVNQHQPESESKAGRRSSVLSVLRQSFRKSKKERPRVTARPESTTARQVSACSLVEDQTSSVSVASVRAGRTLTPSRASIVSRTSLVENNNQPAANMKTATASTGSSITRQLGSRPSYNSSSSTSSSTGATSKATTVEPPTATPRHGGAGGQRFLPETPKLVASAVPPIYANVHSSGNNRQMSPGIAKILEDSGNKRAENGVSRTQSSSQVPPSIPKPAARLSIRQKVEFQPLVGAVVMGLVYHEVAHCIIKQKYLIVCV